MQTSDSEIIVVSHDSHAQEARNAARQLAERTGFEVIAAEELVLAVSELASNLLKHGHGGSLALSIVTEDGRIGILVDASDQGPGIPDIEQAMADGFSTVGSLGLGLGAVNRLMDEFDIHSTRNAGTHIVCRKWVRKESPSAGICPLDSGVATRSRFLEHFNGDAFVIKHWDGCLLAGIIDGLGHGELASRAALAARDYIERHYEAGMRQLFRGVDRACRGTRGVVMALARFDWDRGQITTGSLGNIEARVFPASGTNYFEVRRGIVGLNAPDPIIKEHPWPVENILVLHSDGLRTHWHGNDFPDLMAKPASELAQGLLRSLGKDDDDATVMVVRKARHA